mgnify:FL=1
MPAVDSKQPDGRSNLACYDCHELTPVRDLKRYVGAFLCGACFLEREEEVERLAHARGQTWRPPVMTAVEFLRRERRPPPRREAPGVDRRL